MTKRIVWIDDEYASMRLLVKPLIDAGYFISHFRTFGEVLEHLDVLSQASLFIVDLIIPPGSADEDARYLGLRLLKRLRELGLTQPAVVMSVVSRSNVLKEIEQIPGIVKFISKNSPEPIEEDLLETVQAALGK